MSEVTTGGENSENRRWSRRSVLNLFWGVTLGVGGGKVVDILKSRPVAKDVWPARAEVDGLEKEARLINAGLGDWVEFYAVADRMAQVVGDSLMFPEIMMALDEVASGRQKEAKGLTEGWQVEAKDQAEVLAVAREKAEGMNIVTVNENQLEVARQLAVNLAEVFPVMIIGAPNKLEVHDLRDVIAGQTNPDEGYAELDDDPFIPPGNLDALVRVMIHEVNHSFDWNYLNEERLDQLKPFVPVKEVIGYMERYTRGVYEVVKQWAELPFDQAVKANFGMILSCWDMFDTELGDEERKQLMAQYRQRVDGMEQALAMDDRELERRQREGAAIIKGGSLTDPVVLTPEEALVVKYNVLAHEYMGRLFGTGQKNPLGSWLISQDRHLVAAKRAVVDEVAHTMVDPLYGGGNLGYRTDDGIEPWSKEMNVLMAMRAMAEEARMRMFTANSTVVGMEQFRQKVYAGLVIAEEAPPEVVPEIVPSDEPWEETVSLQQMGVVEVARLNLRKEIEGRFEVHELRVMALPDWPGDPELQLYFVGMKRWVSSVQGIPVMEGGILRMPKRDDEWLFESKSTDDQVEVEAGVVILETDTNFEVVATSEAGLGERRVTNVSMRSGDISRAVYLGVGATGRISESSFIGVDGGGKPLLVKRRGFSYGDGTYLIPADYWAGMEKELGGLDMLVTAGTDSFMVVEIGKRQYTEVLTDARYFPGMKLIEEPKMNGVESANLQLGVRTHQGPYAILDMEVEANEIDLARMFGQDGEWPFVWLRKSQNEGREMVVTLIKWLEDGSRLEMPLRGDLVGIKEWPEGSVELGNLGKG